MLKRWRGRRFDLIELVMIAAIVGVVAYIVPRPAPAPPPADEERAALEKAYGSARNSENEEEWIIRDFFQDRRGGVFVDVGAAHYKSASNTYYLEHELGWSGIAIEPLRHFAADWAQYRPRTQFRSFFVSDVSDDQVKLYTYGEKFAASSSDRTWVEKFGDNPREVQTVTITLDDLLARENIQTFDFLSMDIELAEPKALAGFDIERFRPSLVCIEAHPEVRQQILDYFARHNYVVVGKYLRADEKNLYFSPVRH